MGARGMNHGAGEYEVAVVGGAGHVGAPLAITLAVSGRQTLVYDINHDAVEKMARGELAFVEEGGEELLAEALARGRLGFCTSPDHIRQTVYVVLTIGTPVDEFHNPDLGCVVRCVDQLLPHL